MPYSNMLTNNRCVVARPACVGIVQRQFYDRISRSCECQGGSGKAHVLLWGKVCHISRFPDPPVDYHASTTLSSQSLRPTRYQVVNVPPDVKNHRYFIDHHSHHPTGTFALNILYVETLERDITRWLRAQTDSCTVPGTCTRYHSYSIYYSYTPNMIKKGNSLLFVWLAIQKIT